MGPHVREARAEPTGGLPAALPPAHSPCSPLHPPASPKISLHPGIPSISSHPLYIPCIPAASVSPHMSSHPPAAHCILSISPTSLHPHNLTTSLLYTLHPFASPCLLTSPSILTSPAFPVSPHTSLHCPTFPMFSYTPLYPLHLTTSPRISPCPWFPPSVAIPQGSPVKDPHPCRDLPPIKAGADMWPPSSVCYNHPHLSVGTLRVYSSPCIHFGKCSRGMQPRPCPPRTQQRLMNTTMAVVGADYVHLK